MSRYRLSRVLASGVAAIALSAAWNDPADAATACADLVSLKIAAGEIGLPSGGASIISSQLQTVPADPTMPGSTREYCKVLATA